MRKSGFFTFAFFCLRLFRAPERLGGAENFIFGGFVMKRKFISLLSLAATLLLSVCCFFACNENVEPVVITISQTVSENTTLLEVMEEQKSAGDLHFKIENGLIVQIGTTKNTTNSFWMLYTTDTENANAQWGTFAWNGETLGSAILGAETLVVKQGETYVWVYQSF